MLQLYDLNKVKIKGLRLYKDMNIESVLSSGDKTLSFLYPARLSKDIKEECYIRTKNDEFVVKEISTSGEWNSIKATLNVENLEGQAWEHFDTTEKTISECLTLAVAGTGWTVQVNGVTKKRTIRKTNCSTWDIIQQAKKTYLVEIEFDTINKVVKVAEKLGTDKGVYFMDSLNLSNLDVQSNSYDFYTRLIAIGKDDLKATVENYQYSSKKKTFIWKDERYTDINSLTEDATKKLEEISKPYKAYGADIIDLANTSNKYSILSYGLGDTITLISKDKGIKEKQRIVKITEYPEEPHRNSCEIANSILSFADIQKEYNDTMDTVSNITEDNGTVSEGAIRTAVEHLTVNKLDVGSLNAVEIRVGNLEATSATITQLKAVNASIVNLQANKANITDLTASVGRIEILETSVGDIQTLVNGNLTSNNIQSLILSSDKVTVVNGFIKNAMIENLDVSKINAGDISVNKFRIKSDSGNLLIFDNTIQIKDSTRIRVQIGKDASNDYNMYVWDSTGKLMFDATGLKADGIKNKIIRDDMVSDNANISGDKLNISSVVTSINNGAATLNSSKVHIDGTAQTLDVAFNTLTKKVESDAPTIITDNSVTKLDGAIDGMLKINSISGRTLQNIIKNGNFTNGTSGWGIGNATASVVDGEVVMLASSNIGRLEQRINGTNGNKLYQVALIKTTSSLVGLGIGGSVLQKHSGSGNYERVSNIYVIGTLGYMFTSVADNRHSDWDNIYVKRYMVINLTSMFGVGNEPTKEWCDANISFFEGIQSVGEGENLELVSCGKNLFNNDSTLLKKGFYFSATGGYTEEVNSVLSEFYIKVDSTKNYVWNGNNKNIIIATYKADKTFIERLITYSGSIINSIKFNNNVEYIRISSYQKGFEVLNNFQLEEGTTSTTYEDYKEHRQLITLTNPLRGLPNGVRDTAKENEVTRNVDKDILDNNKNWNFSKSETNVVKFFFLKSLIADNTIGSVICDKFANTYHNKGISGEYDMEGCWAYNQGRIYISILKSKLTQYGFIEGNTGTYVTAFKAWLQANPVTIYYQLATPVKEPIIAEQYMKQFKDGYFLTEGSLINPTADLTYSTSLASATSMMKEVTESNTTALNIQQGKISALISNTTIVKDGVTTQLKDAYNSTVATVDSISSVISSHTSSIDALTGQVLAVDAKTNEVKRTLDGTVATVTSHTASINGLNSTVATQSSSITQLSNQISLKVDGTQVTNIVNGAIDKIEVGGRNLLRNSNNFTTEHWNITNGTVYNDYIEFTGNNSTNLSLKNPISVDNDTTYTIQVKIWCNVDLNVSYNYPLHSQINDEDLNPNNAHDGGSTVLKSQSFIEKEKWHTIIKELKSNTNGTITIKPFIYMLPTGCIARIKEFKLEKGNKATDWTPAPEDVDASITAVGDRVTIVSTKAASIETNLNGITSKVSNIETTTNTMNGNLKDITTRINTAEQKITSDAIVSTVRSSTYYKNDLGAKVSSNEIISCINQTAESIKISASKINLTGYVTVTNLSTAGQTIINGGNIKTGTITGVTISGVTLNGVTLNASNTVTIGTTSSGANPTIILKNSWAGEIGNTKIYSIPTNPGSSNESDTLHITVNSSNNSYKGKVYIDGSNVGCDLEVNGDVIINSGFLVIGGKKNRGWGFSSGNNYWFGLSGDDKYVRMYNNDISVMNGVSYLGSPSGRFIKLYSTQAVDVSSDIRRKTNILAYDEKIESFYDKLKPISYELINGHSGRKHYGFIAQEVESAMNEVGLDYKDMALLQKAPMDAEGNEIDPTTIVDYSTDERIVDYEYSLAYTEMISINTHMIQKLRQEITQLKNEISEIKGLG